MACDGTKKMTHERWLMNQTQPRPYSITLLGDLATVMSLDNKTWLTMVPLVEMAMKI